MRKYCRTVDEHVRPVALFSASVTSQSPYENSSQNWKIKLSQFCFPRISQFWRQLATRFPNDRIPLQTFDVFVARKKKPVLLKTSQVIYCNFKKYLKKFLLASILTVWFYATVETTDKRILFQNRKSGDRSIFISISSGVEVFYCSNT